MKGNHKKYLSLHLKFPGAKLRSLLLLIIFSIFLSAAPGHDEHTRNLKVLYIGNSLTYTNDLPGLITELGKQDGMSITYSSFLFANYSLEDHWNEGKVKAEIEKGGYDFVVAQQGPSALPESQALLLDYVKRFAEVCVKSKSKFVLYMVWPSKARSFDMDNVIASYTKAAEKTSSLLCPAGLAWKYAWQSDPGLPLYASDDFHPAITGSLLAALTIYGRLAGKTDFDFIRYSNNTWKNEITEEQLSVLKQAALRATGGD